MINDMLKPITGTIGKTRIVIGYYPSINGYDAVPLQGIEPTTDELRAIVRHHAELMRLVDECWRDGQTGSWEIRQYPYSSQRVRYYEQFLGKEDVDSIFEDVYKGFNDVDPEVPCQLR
jgi:hypothetical protein